MRLPIKNYFSECDQIRKKLRIGSYLLKNSLMNNFIFCAVQPLENELQISPSATVLKQLEHLRRSSTSQCFFSVNAD